jgi:hypothetical protein
MKEKTIRLRILLMLVLCINFLPNIQAQIFAEYVGSDFAINYKINQINQYIATKNFELRGETLYQRLAFENINVKNDSILVSFQVNKTSDLAFVEEMNRRGAKLHQVIPGRSYYSGFVQIDSLLRFPYLFGNSGLQLHLDLKVSANLDEGPALINSIAYETGGGIPNAGEGIVIAIVDTQFRAWNFAAAMGFLPQNITFYDCSSGNCIETDIPGDNDDCDDGSFCMGHGALSTQTVFDHAPAATYIILNAGFLANSAGRAASILKAAELGAHLISCSQESVNTGWNDNTGIICEAVNDASVSEMLLFFAAGNSAGVDTINNGVHWQSNFIDSNNNDFHEWLGSNEVNNIVTQIPDSANITAFLQCNSSLNREIYRLEFINLATGMVVAQAPANPFAVCTWTNNTGAPANIGMRLRSTFSEKPEFEIFIGWGGRLQFYSTSNQTLSPGNCTNNPNVILVAAVNQANFNDPNPPKIWYSSLGPTNNMANSVKITGPTNTTAAFFNADGVLNMGTYGGTSCATPNVAGAAAAFWSKHPSLSAADVRRILYSKARIYRDWGSVGYDHEFGHGGAYLIDYQGKNLYVHQGHGQDGVAPDSGIFPWYSVRDISDMALPNRNVIMLTNDLQSGPGVIQKNMIINSVGVQGTSRLIE